MITVVARRFVLYLVFACVLCAPLGAPAKPLDLRATVSGFPFWLGTTMYGSQWKVDVEGAGWWFDREHWRRQFAEMDALHLNALVLLHPHPFPAFVDLPDYPEARCLPPETLARSRETMRWILAEGKRHGIKLYFLTWNICLPPGFCAAHRLPEFGADTPLTRAYTRAAVAALFRDFPDFGGIITEAAETPPGCVDFVEHAICGGLRDSGVNPELIFWSWCTYPADSRRIMKAWPRTRLLHYLQYEQFFKPMADPRIGRFSRACGNAPMVAIGGPKSCHGYLFWGDPEWARETVRSLCKQNGTGFLIENYHADPAIGREALAYYAYHPDAPYDPGFWAREVGARYGRPDLGKPLLDAMQHASRILPRLVTLVHSQTDHYAPQLGLPLVYYLEMPTLSSYVFENVQTLDKRGYLRPNLGLCWPNPDWGERVASVREFVAGKAKPGATTPPMIAAQIAAHADACRREVARVRAAHRATDSDYLRGLLDLLDLNTALGDHFAAKVRAAVEWQRFRSAGNASAGRACVARLAESVAAWERVVAVATRIYPGNVGYWRSDLAAAPPWTQNQIWESYAMVQGHWRDNLEPFRRELAIVREEVAHGPRNASLPLWEALRAIPPDRLTPVFADGFETRDDTHWTWAAGATVTHKSAETLGGKGALRLDTRGLPGEWHMPLRTRPEAVRLLPGHRYQVTFRYRVLDPGRTYGNPFAVAARSEAGGVGSDTGTGRTWGARRGAVGTRTVLLTPERFDDYALFFSIHGGAAIVIDEVRVAEVR